MHYVIGLISSIAALVFAVHRLQRAGLDLDALNPFLWYRRAQWRKKHGEKPLYTLSEPVDVAAVLLLGVARIRHRFVKGSRRALDSHESIHGLVWIQRTSEDSRNR